jgi:hypothetical protein
LKNLREGIVGGVDHGLIAAGLISIGRNETRSILVRGDADIEGSVRSVIDLENLLNTQNR